MDVLDMEEGLVQGATRVEAAARCERWHLTEAKTEMKLVTHV